MPGEGFVGRTGNDHAAPPEQRNEDPARAEQRGEKLAHRALGGTLGGASGRASDGVMSPTARDRLYARMFPEDICLGRTENGKRDPLP